MRKFLINQVLLLSVFVLGACNISASSNQKKLENTEFANDSKNKKVELFKVAEHKVFCEEIVPRKCLYIKRAGSKHYEALWDQIQNFKYISGYKYVLKVEVEKIAYPPKDTSGFKYNLKEIVERHKTNSWVYENILLSKWYLTHINGKKIDGGKPFIVFKKGKNEFYGNTGCNSISGSFNINKGYLETSKMRQTKRACANMKNVEPPFVKFLSEKNQIEVEIDRLYIKKNGVVVLEFKSNWSD